MGFLNKVKETIKSMNSTKVGDCFGNGDSWLVCVEAGEDGKYYNMTIRNSYKMEDDEAIEAIRSMLQDRAAFVTTVKACIVDTQHTRKLKKSFSDEEIEKLVEIRSSRQTGSGFQSIQEKMKESAMKSQE